MDELEMKNFIEGLNKKADETKNAIETKASAEEVSKLKEDFKADIEKYAEIVKNQGIELEKFKEVAAKAEIKTFSGALVKAMKDSEDKIKDLKNSAQNNVSLEIKASQGAADIDAGTDFAQMEAGVGQIATRRPFIKGLFRSVPISTEYLKYNDQETVVRDAENVAACAASTPTSKLTWKVRTMQIQKVRDYVDICIDMLDDYSYVAAEIQNLISTDVALQVDSELLLGTDVAPSLNSISNVASTFAAGTYTTSVQAPTTVDLIKVCGGLIADAGQNNAFMADTVLMNPSDALLLTLEKDANNNYLLPNFVTANGVQIGAMRVVVNPLVPADEMYVFDSTKGVIYERRNSRIEMSFDNATNFEQELVTVKASERLNFRVRNVDANAFLHVPSIASSITAITAP